MCYTCFNQIANGATHLHFCYYCNYHSILNRDCAHDSVMKHYESGLLGKLGFNPHAYGARVCVCLVVNCIPARVLL